MKTGPNEMYMTVLITSFDDSIAGIKNYKTMNSQDWQSDFTYVINMR